MIVTRFIGDANDITGEETILRQVSEQLLIEDSQSTLQTTEVRLMGMNRLRLAVLGAFAVGITMARCRSPGLCVSHYRGVWS